jgi:VanZ family protein
VIRRDFAKFWLPPLLWMALIFLMSTDLGSVQHTSRFIGPFLRFFSPTVSEETIHNVQVVVRKGGHLSGYAVLAVLLWRARNRRLLTNIWSWRTAAFAEFISFLYAISDEVHQAFVPTRQASALDVLIDSVGAAAGLFAVWAIGRARAKW